MGEDVEDPNDFFKVFKESYFQDFKPQYEELPADKKAEFMEIFDGMDVMKDEQTL